jgi:hypothetical protein
MASADGSADCDRVTRAGKRSWARSRGVSEGRRRPGRTAHTRVGRKVNEKGEMESSRQVRKRETKNESIKKNKCVGIVGFTPLVRVVRGPRNACWQ